ncbi:hypothetical protein CDO73_01100 [Saccharibacillus sp. O23]|uniref:DUF2357 domain-containing protein n=1 Tax=Saccharibacillus sp. O23 TaxID=2009338 RepID=UPI000B4E121E|nr:DUF2357 domain-containing protein [Saccharibacillus sp. O23]OWR33133.1 hypothetical protein CDO73_01100 [Saccharibacillus sp. O23]
MMPSLPPTLPDSGTELLRIDSRLFEFHIAGEPIHETAERLALHRDSSGGQRIEARFDVRGRPGRTEDLRVRLFSPQTGQAEEWQPGMPAYPCFYETKSYELTLIKADPALDLTFHHENVNLRRRIRPRGSRVLSGTLDFGSEIGETELQIRLGGQTVLSVVIEIFPAKLDYRRDYARLMEEVDEEAYDLSFDFLRRTYRTAESAETPRQSLAEFNAVLREVFGRMESAMLRIGAHPHHRLESERHLVESGRAKRTDRSTLDDLRRHPQRLQTDAQGGLEIAGKRYAPSRLLEPRRKISTDTDENRFLRWMLERTAARIDDLRRELRDSRAGRDPLPEQELALIRRRIGAMLNLDFLQSVGPMRRINVSLVLQMAPGYREMYKLHLLLLRGLSIREGLMRLSLKDMAQLYEYWCFLKLHRLLLRRCRMIRRGGLGIDRSGLFPSLIRGGASRIEYEHLESGARLSLLYNPSMLGRSRPTTEQKPDLLLTLRRPEPERGSGGPGGYGERRFVLDAKYRLDPAVPGSRYDSLYGAPGPLEEDINVMHRYRDAIVRRSRPDGGYERSISSACVLFPYANETEYAEHHFCRSLEKVGVGALPFLPGATRLAEKWLDALLMPDEDGEGNKEGGSR